MAINTCAVSGNVKNLLGSNVQDCTVTASIITPFFHTGSFIAGELASVETDSNGDFTLSCIETETVGQKVTFTFEYYDGVANRKRKQYSVVVPDEDSVELADLVNADPGTAALTTFPASQVTINPAITNMTAENVQDALEELQADVDAINTLADGKILVGNASNAATEVTVTGDITLSNAGVASIASGVIVNADVNSAAGITRSKTASGTAYRILANNNVGVMSENAAITASRAVASDANGQLAASATTATELGYVNGVTSAIQTQLDGKQASGDYITELTGDVTASGPGSVAATVASVGGSAASAVNTATVLVNTAQSGNKVLASPANGSSAAPSFRALAAADIQPINLASTSNGGVTGTLPVGNGGTGAASFTANYVLLGNDTGAFQTVAPGTSGNVLTSNGTTWQSAAAGSSTRTVTTNGTDPGLNGVCKSSAQTSQTTTSTTYADVTNLSCTLTTGGNPVAISVEGTGAGQTGLYSDGGGSGYAVFKFVRGATDLAEYYMGANASARLRYSPGEITFLDTPAAGTYTYKLQFKINGSATTAAVENVRLVVYEIK